MRVLVTAALALALFAATGCGTSDEEEIRAVMKETQRSWQGKQDLARVCELMTPRAEAQMAGFLAGAGKGGSCVAVAALATDGGEQPTAAEIDAASIRIRGDLAVLDAGGEDDPVGLARVDGTWRVDNFLNPSLEPVRRPADRRLTAGSDEHQVRAAFVAVGDAIATGDYRRACALLHSGAEAQLVVARLFAALGETEDEPARSALTCAASLRAISGVEGALAVFAAAATPAADVAAAKVTVDGTRATVEVPGDEPARFVREDGRWLVAADPKPISVPSAPAPEALERCWRRAGARIATTASDLRFAAADAVRGTSIKPGRTSVKGDDWRVFYAHRRGDVDPGIARVFARPAAVPVVAYVRDAARRAGVVEKARACGG